MEWLADDLIGCPPIHRLVQGAGDRQGLRTSLCRNLKTKSGQPYGRIRLEAEERFEPKACAFESAQDPAFAALLWKRRYGQLTAKVTRLGREVQTAEIAARVKRNELTYAQGERMAMFLDLERLGLATSYYPKSVDAARRREAARLGYTSNDTGTESLELDVAELLAPYVQTVGIGHAP